MIKYRASMFLLGTSSFHAKYQSFRLPVLVAFFSTCIAAALKIFDVSMDSFKIGEFFSDDAYRTFATIVSFISVFRTSQAYSRFWEGADLTFEALGDWFDVVSTLLSFCRYSGVDHELIVTFQQKVVRLVSLLNAMIYCELEDKDMEDKRAMRCELIDVASIDRENLLELSKCENKPEIVFQWLQNEVVDSVKSGVLSIPPPLLTRSFQEMGAAMKQYHRSLKFIRVPFPFPYSVILEVLLVIHGLVTPVVVCSWTDRLEWVCIFNSILVFAFWSLHFLAVELENPFDSELNDLNMCEIQRELNQHLLALACDTSRTVRLAVKPAEAERRLRIQAHSKDRISFHESFAALKIHMDVGNHNYSRPHGLFGARSAFSQHTNHSIASTRRFSEASGARESGVCPDSQLPNGGETDRPPSTLWSGWLHVGRSVGPVVRFGCEEAPPPAEMSEESPEFRPAAPVDAIVEEAAQVCRASTGLQLGPVPVSTDAEPPSDESAWAWTSQNTGMCNSSALGPSETLPKGSEVLRVGEIL